MMTTPKVLEFPGRSQSANSGVSDAEARAMALDVARSWIVEAPAGSGKTGLLMQRFLKLLAQVEQPEEVLAITFTRKATAELRERVLGQLAAAMTPLREGVTAFEAQSYALAAAVLARDRAAGWRLLEQPERLQVRTIDAVCAGIAGAMPLLSGSGAGRAPMDKPEPLYRLAARRTLMQLGGADAALDAALRTVLLHRDANLQDCETLLARMLGSREQWGGLVPLGRALDEATLENEVRPKLERALELVVCAGLTRAAKAMPGDMLSGLSWLAAEMSHLPGYKGESPLVICSGRSASPEETVEQLEHWLALIGMLIKKDGGWRARISRADVGFEISPDGKLRLEEILAGVRDNEPLRLALCAVRALPPARYPEEQWRVAKALFRMLVRALAELKVLFAEQGACDFAEMSIAAKSALRADAEGAELAGASGVTLRHLLVDEMQDTSAGQYELIELLTRSWDGSSQTLFLVGDPKQSIYLFRQARVERFLRVMREGRLGELPLGVLRLTANFRSQRALVEDGFNADFARVFPKAGTRAQEQADAFALDVPFVMATAVRDVNADSEGRVFHAAVLGESEADEAESLAGREPEARLNRGRAEAVAIREVVELWRAKPKKLNKEGRAVPWRIAVLARAREHLSPVIAEFKRAGVAYRALEIERLGEQAEVIDVLALTRALLHPADRVAWLAVLHAPWCGLGLADLLAISGGDEEGARRDVLALTAGGRRGRLSEEGRAVFDRAWPVLEAAWAGRGRSSVAVHVERTWRSLGGDAALGARELENVELYFEALRAVEEPGGRVDLGELATRVGTLYARPGRGEEAVELLTLHGAKGLEWDVVMVPGMERKTPAARAELLNWMELDFASGEADGAAAVVLAPIHGKGEESSALYKWLCAVRTDREAAERKRMLYVAATRAREELHLFAAVRRNSKGELCEEKSSLLGAAWGAAAAEFAALETRSAGTVAAANVLEMLKKSVEPQSGVVLDMAAAGVAEKKPPMLRRLPMSFSAAARTEAAMAARLEYVAAGALRRAVRFERPEGSFAVRAFGNVVHRYLQAASEQMLAGGDVSVEGWRGRLAASLRAEGIAPAQVERLADRGMLALRQALGDAAGRWLLGARLEAASEKALPMAGGGVLRVDRMFVAGAAAMEDGASHVWVVDYKTSERGGLSEEAFERKERATYGPQLAAYARALVEAGERRPVMLGLYYPLGAGPQGSGFVWWAYDPDVH